MLTEQKIALDAAIKAAGGYHNCEGYNPALHQALKVFANEHDMWTNTPRDVYIAVLESSDAYYALSQTSFRKLDSYDAANRVAAHYAATE